MSRDPSVVEFLIGVAAFWSCLAAIAFAVLVVVCREQ